MRLPSGPPRLSLPALPLLALIVVLLLVRPPTSSALSAGPGPGPGAAAAGDPRPSRGGGGVRPAGDDAPLSPPRRRRRMRMRIPVLRYEDGWACVNKPAGLTVHRGRGTPRGRPVLRGLLRRQLSRKIFPVHRLDHRTSGAILIAFDAGTTARLQASLTSGDAVKGYLALVRGDVTETTGMMAGMGPGDRVTVDRPLRGTDGIVREAKTDFVLLSSGTTVGEDGDGDGDGGDGRVPGACSVLLCHPRTGRTHQIRRHARSPLGHPILGDTQHGDSHANRWWRTERGLDRLGLHCLSLDLPPMEGTEDGDGDGRIRIVAPLPPELAEFFAREDMAELWERAVGVEPKLATEFYDFRGGTFGRRGE